MTEEYLCFCFGYTRTDIEEDFRRHGRSTIMERILAEKKTGGCQCHRTNPKGI
jgi:hypothetical protein